MLKLPSYVAIMCLLMLMLFCVRCSKDNDLKPKQYDFAIHLLKNTKLKIGDILTQDLADQGSEALYDIEILDSPWLTSEDIDFYDFSSHIIYLHNENIDFLPQPVEMSYPLDWWDKPFVVIANGQRRYVGVFTSYLSSNRWPLPEINDGLNYLLYPQDLLFINWSWVSGNDQNDSRHDSIVKEALTLANLLHEGIKIELKDILLIENSDTATIKYTYSVKNNDESNLYILDPDRMGTNLFHFYNNGPFFIRSDENITRESINKIVEIPEPRDYWDSNWFIKINSGDSITRTVELKGYDHFLTGQYKCGIIFQSIKKIPKNQRVLCDGRYWIGQTTSDIIEIQF